MPPTTGVLMISPFPAPLCGVSDYTATLLRRLDRSVEASARRLDLRRGACVYAADAARALAALARRPRVVHVQYTPTTSGPLLPALAWAARFFGAKVVVSAHERPSTYERRLPAFGALAYRCWERLALAPASSVIVFSRSHRDELAARYGIDAELLHLGVDRETHGAPAPRERSVSPEQRITFAGFVRPSKGVDDLVRAAPLIARKAGRCAISVVGAVAERDHAYAAELRALAHAAARTAGCTVELTGPVGEDAFAERLDRTDVFVFPFRTVSQSITFSRIVASGIPVVSSNVGGVGEVVRDYGVGIVYPPGDIEALADAVVRLLREPELYRACSRRAFEYANMADWGAVAGRHVETYLRVAA